MSRKPKAGANTAKDVERKPVPPIAVPQRQPPDLQAAMQFIDGCVASAPLSRPQHIQAQAALQQIGGAINELEQLKKRK